MTKIGTGAAALTHVRFLIDGIDQGLLVLFAARRQLVTQAAKIKHSSGQPSRDGARECEVYLRARRLGQHLGVPVASSDRLVAALIADACDQQGIAAITVPSKCIALDLGQGAETLGPDKLAPTMKPSADPSESPWSWLRFIPPPARLAPLVRHIPLAWQARLLDAAMRRVLAGPLASGALDELTTRRIGIEVSDLGLRWVVALHAGRMQVCDAGVSAEATVCGTATDLLLLASRREDADTLFLQRRLRLTGDTDLGLTARNLLDQLPWEDIPLGLRIALHRGAGLAQLARAAHCGGSNKNAPIKDVPTKDTRMVRV